MNPVRIHIFGASGSGTTTLGKHVAQRTNVPCFDIDSYFWRKTVPPFTEKRHADERIAALESDLGDRSGCVVSGSLCGWGDRLIPRISVAVFIHVDSEVRMQRLASRERQLYGARIDAGGTCTKFFATS